MLAAQGVAVQPAQLVRMVTSGAAAIAGLADSLGCIAPPRLADLRAALLARFPQTGPIFA